MSKVFERAIELASENYEDLEAARNRIKELEYLLGDLEEYFDGRADADCDQDDFIPNEEMQILTRIREFVR